jgi:hypothetical protein
MPKRSRAREGERGAIELPHYEAGTAHSRAPIPCESGGYQLSFTPAA